MGSDIITYSKIREIQRDERTKTTLIKLPDNIIELIQIYLKEKKNILEKNKDDSNLFSQDIYSRIEYELKNAIRSIANIFEIREKKIVDKAFQTAKNDVKIKDTTNMLEFEKELFTQLVQTFNNYNNDCILALLKNEKPSFSNSQQVGQNEKPSFSNSQQVGQNKELSSLNNEQIHQNEKPNFSKDEKEINSETQEQPLKREEAISNKSDKMLVRITSDVPAFQWEDNKTMGPFKKEDVVFIPKRLGNLLVKQERGEEVIQK